MCITAEAEEDDLMVVDEPDVIETPARKRKMSDDSSTPTTKKLRTDDAEAEEDVVVL